MNADEWYAKGEKVEINGFQHFIYHSKNNKPYLLILHGYPTCGYDFHKAIPFLEQHYCVVVHDHLGFGYSDKPKKFSYSMMEQTDQALLLWRELGITEATILAHDYGTSIATELVARHLENDLTSMNIHQLLLCNGSMHVEMAQLLLIQRLLLNKLTGPLVAKLSNRTNFEVSMKRIYWDPTKLTDHEVDALFAMMKYNGGRHVLHKVTQYIKQRYTYWDRWIGGLQTTDLPIHIIWAKNDPVAIYAMATTLQEEITNSRLITLKNLGHYPMLEAPERWSKAVIGTLSAY